MKIAEDLQKYLDENIEDIATSHIEAYKDRYTGQKRSERMVVGKKYSCQQIRNQNGIGEIRYLSYRAAFIKVLWIEFV